MTNKPKDNRTFKLKDNTTCTHTQHNILYISISVVGGLSNYTCSVSMSSIWDDRPMVFKFNPDESI